MRMNLKIEFGGWELENRLKINRCYGTKDIRPWIIDLLKPTINEKILDVGCGSGEQVIPFAKETKNKSEIIGIDVSKKLLNLAKKEAEEKGVKIKLLRHDANNNLPFDDEYFDAVTCCFTIYHIKNRLNLINEFYRTLKPGGRLLITGPDPENNQEMFDFFKKVNIKISQMPRDLFKNEIGNNLEKKFSKEKYSVFKNKVNFPSTTDFISYIKMTQLFLDNVPSGKQKDVCKQLEHIIEKNNELTLTKIVGAYTAWK